MPQPWYTETVIEAEVLEAEEVLGHGGDHGQVRAVVRADKPGDDHHECESAHGGAHLIDPLACFIRDVLGDGSEGENGEQDSLGGHDEDHTASIVVRESGVDDAADSVAQRQDTHCDGAVGLKAGTRDQWTPSCR